MYMAPEVSRRESYNEKVGCRVKNAMKGGSCLWTLQLTARLCGFCFCHPQIDIYSLGVILYELFMGYPILCTISHSGQPQEVENYAKRCVRSRAITYEHCM
jgi:serine/threonine protein kinase